ncbi:DegV family protein [Metamycoplasma buccale]|uniref:DegV family protein n=1 Tax=Metamycoplasma buccale TaxID=55602 RepID=UPI00398F3FCB
MKIKIILDSSSGLNKIEAEKLGWELMPLRTEINDISYENGVNMDTYEFAKIWKSNKKVDARTSCTPPGDITKMVDKYIENYDKIIIYPISKELSSQYSLLYNLYKDNEKVYIVPSRKISFLMVKDLLILEEELKNGKSFTEAIKVFDEPHERLILIPEFNDALVKGGRLSKAAAVIAKLLKIVPIIKVENGFLEKYGIGRVFRKTLTKTLKEIYEKEYKDDQNEMNDYHLIIMDAANDNISEIAKELKESIGFKNAYNWILSTDISVHTGIGAIAFAIIKVPNVIKEKFISLFKKY